MSRNDKIILLFILAAGFILRLNNLSSRSLWTDEFFTLFQSTGKATDINNLLDYLSKQKQPKVLTAGYVKTFLKFDQTKTIKDTSSGLLRTDTHPPLYFWIIHIWMKCFGDSAFSIRFFSLLMGVIAIWLAYCVTGFLFNRGAKIFSALFMSLGAFGVRYSQETRAYNLIMVLGLLSWIFLLRFEKEDKGADIIWFTVFSALGFYTHYFYSFISISQFVYFSFIYINQTRKIRRFYFAFLASLLLFVPWSSMLFLQGYNFHNAEWIFGYPGVSNKIYYVFLGITRYLVIFDRYGAPELIVLVVSAILFIFMGCYAIKDMWKMYPRQLFFCLLMFLMPLSAMLFIDVLQHGALLKQERFWMFSFIGFVPVTGYFLDYTFSRKRLVVLAFVLLMLFSSVTVSKAHFGPAPREASLWINKESAGSTSVVILCNIRSVVFAQAYYLDKDISLLPVSDEGQLIEGLKALSEYAERIFIVRHFHRTDTSLLDLPFMGIKDIAAEFKFKAEFEKGDIRVTEYVNTPHQSKIGRSLPAQNQINAQTKKKSLKNPIFT